MSTIRYISRCVHKHYPDGAVGWAEVEEDGTTGTGRFIVIPGVSCDGGAQCVTSAPPFDAPRDAQPARLGEGAP